MNEQDLRALVRDAVARHLGHGAPHGEPEPAPASGVPSRAPQAEPSGLPHASHGVYASLVNVGEACLIEPSVGCTHCNYCRSHGH